MGQRRIAVEDVGQMRRSLAISPPLPVKLIEAVLDSCEQLLCERRQLREVLDRLQPGFQDTRQILVETHRMVDDS